MAMHASRPTQDQNFSVYFDGFEANGSTVKKNTGGLGGRKAHNYISNSGKPFALQASRKHNMKHVIPIGEDLGVSKKAQVPVGGGLQFVSKPLEKVQVSARKALGDLTNSAKPFNQQQGLKKRDPRKKSLTVAEDEGENVPFSIAEECFLHNHEECVKSQKKGLDMDQFLKIIGLDEDVSCPPVACIPLTRKSEEENLNIFFEMEEISEPIIEDRPLQSEKTKLLHSGLLSPISGSPNSPRIAYNMKEYDEFPSFILAETPRRSK